MSINNEKNSSLVEKQKKKNKKKSSQTFHNLQVLIYAKYTNASEEAAWDKRYAKQ